MIQLKTWGGYDIWVNSAHIVAIQAPGKITEVSLSNGQTHQVRETVEEVLKKLAMHDFIDKSGVPEGYYMMKVDKPTRMAP